MASCQPSDGYLQITRYRKVGAVVGEKTESEMKVRADSQEGVHGVELGRCRDLVMSNEARFPSGSEQTNNAILECTTKCDKFQGYAETNDIRLKNNGNKKLRQMSGQEDISEFLRLSRSMGWSNKQPCRVGGLEPVTCSAESARVFRVMSRCTNFSLLQESCDNKTK